MLWSDRSIQPRTEGEAYGGAVIFNIGQQGTTWHPPPGALREVVDQGMRTLVAREADEIVMTNAHEVSIPGVFEEALTQGVRHAHNFNPVHGALLQFPDPDVFGDGVLLQSTNHQEPALASHQVGRSEERGHGSPDYTPHSVLHVEGYDSIWISGDPEVEAVAECVSKGVVCYWLYQPQEFCGVNSQG